MIARHPDGWRAAQASAVAVDHIGVVVHDLAREVTQWRALGFQVSDPSPLLATDAAGRPVPLGQSSAHIVFENAYIELSSPDAGSGNHLEPYLARGEGVRILVLSTQDCAAAHAGLAPEYPDLPRLGHAARRVVAGDITGTARFVWFALPFDLLPGVLSAVVEHETPELVFHPDLCRHANGARRLSRFIAVGRPGDRVALVLPSGSVPRSAPLDLAPHDSSLRIAGFAVRSDAGGSEAFFAIGG